MRLLKAELQKPRCRKYFFSLNKVEKEIQITEFQISCEVTQKTVANSFSTKHSNTFIVQNIIRSLHDVFGP